MWSLYLFVGPDMELADGLHSEPKLYLSIWFLRTNAAFLLSLGDLAVTDSWLSFPDSHSEIGPIPL